MTGVRVPLHAAFVLVACFALQAGVPERTLPLGPSSTVTFLEVVGPGTEVPEGFFEGKGRGRPVFCTASGARSVSWALDVGGCFDLSRYFLPVSGRLVARVRLRPASAGGRTLLVYSYNRYTRIRVSVGGRGLFDGVGDKEVPVRVPLVLTDDAEVVVCLEVSPRYRYSFIALVWEGGADDRVLTPPEMDLGREVFYALLPTLTPLASRPGEEVVLSFPASGVPVGASVEGLQVRLPDGGGKSIGKEGEVSSLLPGQSMSPYWRFTLNMGELEREVRFPNPSGIEAAFRGLKAKAQKIPLIERVKCPVFLLRVEQLEEMLGPDAFTRDWEKALQWTEEAEKAWEVESKDGDFYGRRPGFREDAYVSVVDLSPQPYLLYIPATAKPPWPLVVYLHGYVPSYVPSDWIGPNPEELALYERLGAVWVCPFGRSNTDFLTVGERDVLDVMGEIKRRFEVDEDRVYLVGYSMGGSGVWTLLCHYPDIWASALILAGRTDFYLWHDLDPATLSPWLNFMIRMDNPIDLVCNAARVPLTVLHGDVDWVVKKGHSVNMVRKLKELGGTADLFWLTGCDHWRALLALQEEDIVKRIFEYRRSERSAASGRYIVYTPKYGQVGGLSVDGLQNWLQAGEVSFSEDNEEVKLHCKGVAALRLPKDLADLVPEGFESAEGICRPVIDEPREGGVSPFPAKGPGVSGCFKDVTCGPFAIVYGTSGRRNSALKEAAEKWAETWYAFAKGRALVYADRDLPEEVFRQRSLILVGEAEENSVVRRISQRVPFRIERGKITLVGSGGREMELGGGGEDEGYIITYPNPLTGMYAAFTGSVMWGERLSINHKWDFVPDIVVFRKGGEGFMDADECLWAGFFDEYWRVDKRLLFRGHKASSKQVVTTPDD